MLAVLLTIGTQALVVLLNVGTGIITARVLGAEGRGAFTAATIWPQFFSGMAGLGLPSAVIYFARLKPEAHPEIAGAAYIITTVMAAVVTVFGIAVAPLLISDADINSLGLVRFCILWTCFSMYTIIARQSALAAGAFRVFASSNYFSPFFYLIALVLTWGLVGLTPVSACVCLMISSPAGLMWTSYLMRGRVSARLRGAKQWMKPLIAYAARLAPSEVAGTVLGFIDRIVLIPFLSPSDLGLYAVAYSLSRLMFVLQVSVTSVLYPSMTGRNAADVKALHDLAFRLVFCAALCVIVFTFLLAPFALKTVYGPDFIDAGVLLRILMIEAALGCLAQVTVNLFLSLKRPGLVSWVQLICLAFTVAGLLVLVPRFGATGAAIALLLSAVIRLFSLLCSTVVLFDMSLPTLIVTPADVRYIRAKLS